MEGSADCPRVTACLPIPQPASARLVASPAPFQLQHQRLVRKTCGLCTVSHRSSGTDSRDSSLRSVLARPPLASLCIAILLTIDSQISRVLWLRILRQRANGLSGRIATNQPFRLSRRFTRRVLFSLLAFSNQPAARVSSIRYFIANKTAQA